MSVVEQNKKGQAGKLSQTKEERRMKNPGMKKECKKKKLLLQYCYLVSASHLELKGFK